MYYRGISSFLHNSYQEMSKLSDVMALRLDDDLVWDFLCILICCLGYVLAKFCITIYIKSKPLFPLLCQQKRLSLCFVLL